MRLAVARSRSQGQVGARWAQRDRVHLATQTSQRAPMWHQVRATYTPHQTKNYYYTYFEVDPPTDRRLQCSCEHTLRSSDFDAAPAGGHSSNEMEGGDDDYMHTLRCTNVVGVRDCALGWRLCMACRPSEEIIQDIEFMLCSGYILSFTCASLL